MFDAYQSSCCLFKADLISCPFIPLFPQALREELHRMMSREPCGKALVFSQFTSMLALIQHRLEQARHRVVASIGRGSYSRGDTYISPGPRDPTVTTHLLQVGIRVVRLDGSMSLDARDRVINQFTNDPEVRHLEWDDLDLKDQRPTLAYGALIIA